MSEQIKSSHIVWKKPPFIKSDLLRWFIWLGIGIYLAFAFGTLDINWKRVAEEFQEELISLVVFFRLILLQI